MAESYVAMLHEAGYDKAVWVGLSMGGYLVTDLYRLHPEAVQAWRYATPWHPAMA